MRQYLDEALLAYSRSEDYPFHMPGHKRRRLGDFVPEEIDITEIDGFDNLHHAEGILKEGQERLASLFGADESFYLVNGSTAGILAAICGCMKKGGRLLIGRNCHRSVYHAAYLMEARLTYLWPESTDFGIQGSIAPEQVQRMLKEYPDVQAVVVTSPTYEGVVSDIASIAAAVHERGIPLIVDAAHGAHFGFSEAFPPKAIALGADLSVESLHKTLPAYTQSAVLHLRKTSGRIPEKKYRFDPERVRRYLEIFQSSSPSYVLMAGMDRCVRLLEEDVKKYRRPDQRGGSLLGIFEERLRRFYERCGEFQRVMVFPHTDFSCSKGGIFGKDPSKILIFAENAGLNGQQLYDLLRERYHLQPEMASGNFVCAITTIMDTAEGFERLYAALREIDERADAGRDPDGTTKRILTPDELYRPQIKSMEIAEATDAEKTDLFFREAGGRISGDFLLLYPPGIPILVPGEIITEEVLKTLEICLARGMRVQGLQNPENDRIRVVSAKEHGFADRENG